MAELDSAMNSERFNTVFVSSELEGVNREFGNELTSHLTKFLTLESLVTSLEKAQTRFNKMHFANME